MNLSNCDYSIRTDGRHRKDFYSEGIDLPNKRSLLIIKSIISEKINMINLVYYFSNIKPKSKRHKLLKTK